MLRNSIVLIALSIICVLADFCCEIAYADNSATTDFFSVSLHKKSKNKSVKHKKKPNSEEQVNRDKQERDKQEAMKSKMTFGDRVILLKKKVASSWHEIKSNPEGLLKGTLQEIDKNLFSMFWWLFGGTILFVIFIFLIKGLNIKCLLVIVCLFILSEVFFLASSLYYEFWTLSLFIFAVTGAQVFATSDDNESISMCLCLLAILAVVGIVVEFYQYFAAKSGIEKVFWGVCVFFVFYLIGTFGEGIIAVLIGLFVGGCIGGYLIQEGMNPAAGVAIAVGIVALIVALIGAVVALVSGGFSIGLADHKKTDEYLMSDEGQRHIRKENYLRMIKKEEEKNKK